MADNNANNNDNPTPKPFFTEGEEFQLNVYEDTHKVCVDDLFEMLTHEMDASADDMLQAVEEYCYLANSLHYKLFGLKLKPLRCGIELEDGTRSEMFDWGTMSSELFDNLVQKHYGSTGGVPPVVIFTVVKVDTSL